MKTCCIVIILALSVSSCADDSDTSESSANTAQSNPGAAGAGQGNTGSTTDGDAARDEVGVQADAISASDAASVEENAIDAGVVLDGQEADDAGPTEESVGFCESLALPVRAFDALGPYGLARHATAEDFSFPQFDGTTWTLSEQWTGCDSYIFIGSARTHSGLDDTSIWERDLETLLLSSPPNVHYFFVPTRSQGEAVAEANAMQTRIDELLSQLTVEEVLQWTGRLHVAGGHVSQLDSWLGQLLGSGYGGYYGATIDRRQQIRYMGNFADVTRYSQALSDAGEWMWEANMAYAAHEARHFNYEIERDATLSAQENVTVLSPLLHEVFGGTKEIEVTFPDAETMAGFDTFELDLIMDCPDPAQGEFGNCGAWDYLAYVHLQEVDEAGEVSWREVARFITTYHREGRYLVDATPMLVYLAEGGTRTLRVDVSSQTYRTSLDLRLRNAGKGIRPTSAHYLYSGGGFGSGYSDNYEPMEIDIPETAVKVEVWAIITGHGMATNNCAEFCDHRHTFTVNGEYFQKGHPEVGDNEGCIGQIENGMVPNQGGTWWFGRGGWCPGQQVDPWAADVTAVITPGEMATISYQGTLGSTTPPDGAGNIRMVSYLVFYE